MTTCNRLQLELSPGVRMKHVMIMSVSLCFEYVQINNDADCSGCVITAKSLPYTYLIIQMGHQVSWLLFPLHFQVLPSSFFTNFFKQATSAFRVCETFSTGAYYKSDIVGLPVVAQG